jgi:hypothetical protein
MDSIAAEAPRAETEAEAESRIETAEDATNACSICKEHVVASTGCVELICTHAFHYACVTRWFLAQRSCGAQPSCPVCRREIAGSVFERFPAPHDNQEQGQGQGEGQEGQGEDDNEDEDDVQNAAHQWNFVDAPKLFWDPLQEPGSRAREELLRNIRALRSSPAHALKKTKTRLHAPKKRRLHAQTGNDVGAGAGTETESESERVDVRALCALSGGLSPAELANNLESLVDVHRAHAFRAPPVLLLGHTVLLPELRTALCALPALDNAFAMLLNMFDAAVGVARSVLLETCFERSLGATRGRGTGGLGRRNAGHLDEPHVSGVLLVTMHAPRRLGGTAVPIPMPCVHDPAVVAASARALARERLAVATRAALSARLLMHERNHTTAPTSHARLLTQINARVDNAVCMAQDDVASSVSLANDTTTPLVMVTRVALSPSQFAIMYALNVWHSAVRLAVATGREIDLLETIVAQFVVEAEGPADVSFSALTILVERAVRAVCYAADCNPTRHVREDNDYSDDDDDDD